MMLGSVEAVHSTWASTWRCSAPKVSEFLCVFFFSSVSRCFYVFLGVSMCFYVFLCVSICF